MNSKVLTGSILLSNFEVAVSSLISGISDKSTSLNGRGESFVSNVCSVSKCDGGGGKSVEMVGFDGEIDAEIGSIIGFEIGSKIGSEIGTSIISGAVGIVETPIAGIAEIDGIF